MASDRLSSTPESYPIGRGEMAAGRQIALRPAAQVNDAHGAALERHWADHRLVRGIRPEVPDGSMPFPALDQPHLEVAGRYRHLHSVAGADIDRDHVLTRSTIVELHDRVRVARLHLEPRDRSAGIERARDSHAARGRERLARRGIRQPVGPFPGIM